MTPHIKIEWLITEYFTLCSDQMYKYAYNKRNNPRFNHIFTKFVYIWAVKTYKIDKRYGKGIDF